MLNNFLSLSEAVLHISAVFMPNRFLSQNVIANAFNLSLFALRPYFNLCS